MTEWRPIEGWEEFYEVSDSGQVRSLDRRVRTWHGTRLVRGAVLQPVFRHGYAHIGLYRDGRRGKLIGIHQLVMLAFVGPPPPGMEVLHDDNDRGNAALANLRYGTASENQRDKRRHGTDPYVNRERCPFDHLLEAPNLVRAQLLLGWRQCRSCHQTHSFLNAHPELDFKTEADRRYELIMAGAQAGAPRLTPAGEVAREVAQPGASMARARSAPEGAPG